MIPTPLLLADLLEGNGLNNLGEGEFIIPESLLTTLLESIDLPLPITGVSVKCQSGFFVVIVKLDLRGQGVPLKPQVEQMFELERLRLEPLDQFILLKPRGGLRIREETLGKSRLSPVTGAIVTTILHTPTLLKLIRDRFPRSVHYDNGRLHINLAGSAALEGLTGRAIDLGHVKLNLLEFLSIRDVDVEKKRVVIRFRFEKEQLLARLREPPPEGFYSRRREDGPDESRMLTAGEGPDPGPQVEESRRDKVARVAKGVGKVGVGLIGRVFSRGRG